MPLTTTIVDTHTAALQALHAGLGADLSNALRLGREDICDLDEDNKIISKYLKILDRYDASGGTSVLNNAANCITESSINSIIDHSYRLLNGY